MSLPGGRRTPLHRKAPDGRRRALQLSAGVAVVAVGVASAASAGAFSAPASTAGKNPTRASTASPHAGTPARRVAGTATVGAARAAGGDRSSPHTLVAGGRGGAAGRSPSGHGAMSPTARRGAARRVAPPAGSPTSGSPTTTSPAAGPPLEAPAPVDQPTTTSAPTTSLPASQVLVEVLNGTGTPGQATAVASALHAEGFAVNGTGNATSFQNAVTVLDYGDGAEVAAQSLAAHLAGEVQLQADSSVPAGEVDLVTGSSFGGVH